MDSKLVLFCLTLLLSLIWRGIHRYVFKRLRPRFEGHELFLIDKLTFYIVLSFGWIVALHRAGAELKDLLATAGILTVAIGFAAKTSFSNLISGVILLGTKVIQRGEIVEVAGHVGLIENIDIFTTSLRTFENVLITLPNEKLFTEQIHNYSKYSIRRISFDFTIRAEQLSEAFLEETLHLVKELDCILIDPEPAYVLTSDPKYGVNISYRAWCEASQVIQARNRLTLLVSDLLSQAQIRSGGELLLVNPFEVTEAKQDGA